MLFDLLVCIELWLLDAVIIYSGQFRRAGGFLNCPEGGSRALNASDLPKERTHQTALLYQGMSKGIMAYTQPLCHPISCTEDEPTGATLVTENTSDVEDDAQDSLSPRPVKGSNAVSPDGEDAAVHPKRKDARLDRKVPTCSLFAP